MVTKLGLQMLLVQVILETAMHITVCLSVLFALVLLPRC